MNILITTGIYPPDVGGPARFVPLIADKLSIKNNVNVLTLSENLGSSEKVNYKVTRIIRKQNKIIRFLKSILLIIKIGKGSDIIFINGLWFEAYIANLFIRKNTIRKIVGDQYGKNITHNIKLMTNLMNFKIKNII